MPKTNARSPSLTSQESYRGVILADLVADVPIYDANQTNRRTSSSGSKGLNLSDLKDKKEINYGYDGQMDGDTASPAVVSVDTMETVNIRSGKSNGAGISKGVILNAMQFGSPDAKLRLDLEKNDKSIALNNEVPLPMSEAPQDLKDETLIGGFSEMSLLRKVAFGASFLPSILFVLCFAVILPCEKPELCIRENFLMKMDSTEIENAKAIDNIIFMSQDVNGNSLRSVDKHGELIFKVGIDEASRFIDCGNVASPDRKDCIIMFESGKLRYFNTSNGYMIWDRNLIEDDVMPSDPVILPDCNGDQIAEVAMAVSRKRIKVLSHGNIVYNLDISGCEKVPTKLTAWSRNETTDLVFVCQKKEEDVLLRIQQSEWCYTEKDVLKKESILLSKDVGDLEDSVLLPTTNGLIVWVKDELFLISPEGAKVWEITTESHLRRNRFLLYGKFDAKENQIALISSLLTSKFSATTVNFENGNTTWTKSIPNAEATDVVYVQGEKKDFALVTMKKVNPPKDLASEAVARINGVSSTIMSFIANEEINAQGLNTTKGTLEEETTIMELDGKDGLTIDKKDLSSDGYQYDSTLGIHVSAAQSSKPLDLFIVSTSAGNETSKTSFIRGLTIANWDTSKKEHHCIMK